MIGDTFHDIDKFFITFNVLRKIIAQELIGLILKELNQLYSFKSRIMNDSQFKFILLRRLFAICCHWIFSFGIKWKCYNYDSDREFYYNLCFSGDKQSKS